MIYILGKGGHAKVLQEELIEQPHCMGYTVTMLSAEEEERIMPTDRLIVGIGIGLDIGIPRDRIRLFDQYFQTNLFITSIAKTAAVSRSAFIATGTDIGTLAMVGPDAKIGWNVLVNHGAQVAHDCMIGDHCIISAGAIICGNVTLGRACAIGAGAIIVQNVTLPDETRVPAGTLVVGPDDFRKPTFDQRLHPNVQPG